LESRTIFAKSSEQIIDDNIAAQEYESILNTCKNLGLKQIETSNFSFFDAKHNNLYWYGYPYFGIGTGAHGLLPPTTALPYGIRYKVGSTAKERAPGDDILKYNTTENIAQNFQMIFEPPRSRTDMIEELLFTLLRTQKGIPLDWLTSVFDNPNIVESKILSQPQMQRALNEGKIIITPSHISVAPQEKIRGDAWALTFITHLL
jgi:oxygen-independent coproporphyrinogen-3 oxidase